MLKQTSPPMPTSPVRGRAGVAIRSPAPRPQLTIGRVMVGIAILAVVLWLAAHYPGLSVLLLFVTINAFTFVLTRPPDVRRTPRRAPRRFRFSIRQIMVAAVVVAVYSAVVRAIVFAGIEAANPGGAFRATPMPAIILWVGAALLVAFGVLIYLGWYLIALSRVGSRAMTGGEFMFGLSRKERRAKIVQDPFPPEWLAILEKNFPLYARLPEGDRGELQGLIQVFLAEKAFEGCGGLEITDEIRVTIAAQACQLLLRRETDVYPKLITILVYPSAYVSNMPRHGPRGIVTEGPQGRLGEAWTSGVVVLSWDDVKRGAADIRDGHNVVFHEFAHQLDQEDGSSDGAPVLPRRNLYSAWARVLGAEYEELRKAAETGKKSVLDTYGATEPAEFFAVATEAFFEKPVQLKKKHPELYEELKMYYGQDPEADFVERKAP